MTLIEGIINVVTHEIFLSVTIIFIVCQILKLLTKSNERGKLYWKGLIEDGGMPSSHTASVVALSTSIGLLEGFTAPIFFVAGAFSIIVMRDAFGIRHNVDKLTMKINNLIKAENLKIKQADIVSGHTFWQVLNGFLLGVIGVLILHFWIL
ncbi:divergent PAP2 family protein [Thermoproteota archaeon]